MTDDGRVEESMDEDEVIEDVGAQTVEAEEESISRGDAENAVNKHQGRGIRKSASSYERHEPIRCFEGSARPHEAFWAFRNSSDGSNEPELELYGYISEYSWFDDDITPKMFKDDLWRYGNGGPVTIRMNSGGGDVIAASVMKSVLIDYPGKVTVKIDGLAASAATIVAMAGDRVMMQESAYFMIHDPLVSIMLAVLNVEEVARLLDSLKVAKSGILDAYVSKTGLSRDRLANMMTRETWMTANEAAEMGFVDDVITAGDKDKDKKKKKSVMQNAAVINSLLNYRNVPEELLARMERPTDVQTQEAIEAERLRAEVKLLKKE